MGFRGGAGIAGQIVIGEYHLWYLLMLIGVLCLLPVLRCIAANRRLLVYSCALCLGLSFFGYAPLLGKLLNFPFEDPATDFHVAFSYAGYCLLGYLISVAPLDRLRRYLPAALVLSTLSVALTAVGTWWLSMAAGHDVYDLYDYLLPNVLVPSFTVFALARLSLRHMRSRSVGLLSMTAKCSLGVYLFHPLLLFASKEWALGAVRLSAPLALAWAIALWGVSLGAVLFWRTLSNMLKRVVSA